MSIRPPFYDFLNGHTAKYLKENLSISLMQYQDFECPQIIINDGTKIENRDGFAFYRDGEEEYLMFYYLEYFKDKYIKKNQFPKYHVSFCSTREEIKNFLYSTKMPVSIRNRDTGKWYENKYLQCCKNCKRIIRSSLWSSVGNWYDVILHHAENSENPSYQLTGSMRGYLSNWRQVSEAYREKSGWKCENQHCRIDLSDLNDRRYLHTHHVDGDKRNNRKSNFRALCILCHGLEHPKNLKLGKGVSEIEHFIDNYRSRLRNSLINNFLEIVSM